MNELLPDEVALILSKLPPRLAQLRQKYPTAIWNAADCWDDAPLPSNYIPSTSKSIMPIKRIVHIFITRTTKSSTSTYQLM